VAYAVPGGGTARLSDMQLSPVYNQISVMAVDDKNNASPPAEAHVTLLSAGLSGVKVFPNPWRADRDTGKLITFDSLRGSVVTPIFSPRLAAFWNRTI